MPKSLRAYQTQNGLYAFLLRSKRNAYSDRFSCVPLSINLFSYSSSVNSYSTHTQAAPSHFIALDIPGSAPRKNSSDVLSYSPPPTGINLFLNRTPSPFLSIFIYKYFRLHSGMASTTQGRTYPPPYGRPIRWPHFSISSLSGLSLVS